MKPAPFSYEAPATLEAALISLAKSDGEAKLIAGGQSLAPMLNMRLARPGHLIDIGGLAGLDFIRRDGERIVIGALARHEDVAHDPVLRRDCPLLAYAAGTIGHYAIRQRGTIGGSLAHADPAAQYPLVAVALGAEIEVASTEGRRTVAAEDFFQGIFTTALAPDEMIVAVTFPVLRKQTGWGFRLLSRRAGDFAIAVVAVRLDREGDGRIGSLDIAVGGIAATPQKLDGQALAAAAGAHDTGWAERAARAASEAALYEDNEQFTADYRRDVVAALAQDALQDAWERASS